GPLVPLSGGGPCPRAPHPLRRPLLLQGPALVRSARPGGPRALPGRPAGPARRRPRRLVRRDRRLRQAPLAPLVLDVFQSSAAAADGVGVAQGPRAAAAPRHAGDTAAPAPPPGRGRVRRRLPRAGEGPGGLVLPVGFRTGP